MVPCSTHWWKLVNLCWQIAWQLAGGPIKNLNDFEEGLNAAMLTFCVMKTVEEEVPDCVVVQTTC